MDDQKHKAKQFRALHVRGKPLVLFNIWDAGSAKAVAAAQLDLSRIGLERVAGRCVDPLPAAPNGTGTRSYPVQTFVDLDRAHGLGFGRDENVAPIHKSPTSRWGYPCCRHQSAGCRSLASTPPRVYNGNPILRL